MEPRTFDRARKEIFAFLDETFEKHLGIYLDKGTTFFDTLGSINADEASYRATGKNASIAAHVRHAAFYLRVMEDHIRGALQDDKVNWREIWENDRALSTEEWKALVAEFRQAYARIRRFFEDPATWEREDAFGGSIAMIAHTAYHLGAVRQALALMRARVAART